MKTIFTLLFLAAACGVAYAAVSPETDAQLVLKKRAERVPVVLRVRLISAGQADKYRWPKVELISVIKNESKHQFPKQFEIAHYSWEAGIPAGTSTVYLERYNPEREDLWKLLGGSAALGVSHPVTE